MENTLEAGAVEGTLGSRSIRELTYWLTSDVKRETAALYIDEVVLRTPHSVDLHYYRNPEANDDDDQDDDCQFIVREKIQAKKVTYLTQEWRRRARLWKT